MHKSDRQQPSSIQTQQNQLPEEVPESSVFYKELDGFLLYKGYDKGFKPSKENISR